MTFGDMTLREFAAWCWCANCDKCPFNDRECDDEGMLPFFLCNAQILDVEVPSVDTMNLS